MDKDIINPQVSQRFFEALETLIAQRTIAGIGEFCRRYGINERCAYFQRTEPERRILRPSWLTYLVRDYHVNASWLLLGVGNMFAEGPILSEKRAKTVQEIKRLADSLL